MVVYVFCRFVSITGSDLSPSVLVVVVVVVCQCFGSRPRCGVCVVVVVLVPCLPTVVVAVAVRVNFITPPAFVALCAVSRLLIVATVARSDLLPFPVNVFVARRLGGGAWLGVSLTYFVNFGAAGDYSSPFYKK